MQKCSFCGGELIDLKHSAPNKRFYLTEIELSEKGSTALPMKGIPLKGLICSSCFHVELFKDVQLVAEHSASNPK